MKLLFVYVLLAVCIAENCGVWDHNCVGVSDYYAKQTLKIKTNMKGFVKKAEYIEYRYTDTCISDPYLVIKTSYDVKVKKDQTLNTDANYMVKVLDIMILTQNKTAFQERKMSCEPAISGAYRSIRGMTILNKGQPHLVAEQTSIGTTSESNIMYEGIMLKRGFPNTPYSRTNDDGCVNVGAIVGWAIGGTIAVVIILIAVFFVYVSVRRVSKVNEGGYLTYAAKTDLKTFKTDAANI